MTKKAKISSRKQTSLKSEIKAICDIMRRSSCAGAMQYVPELTWLLFLRILDVREESEAENAATLGYTFIPSLTAPYRWRDWANKDGSKRKELVDGKLGAYFEFVNDKLITYLKELKENPEASPHQKVISEILSGVERTRIDTEKNLLDILDKVDAISTDNIDDTHIFTMSQVYEELLLKMGEKGNDGGQFFTPREIIRAMVKAIDSKPGETVYDPCCGTGGFLVQSYLWEPLKIPFER
jgi:type I restriction enzyme M protein